MKFGRCGRCRYGITAMDGSATYTVCALMPPVAIEIDIPNRGAPSVLERKMTWQRPSMAMLGWCGQFKLGLRRLFGYGPRA